jgi:hypothetical protein
MSQILGIASEAEALAQRIQNRAAGRIRSLISDAQGEAEGREIWNKLWGASVSEDGLVAPVDPSDIKSVYRMGRERQAAAQAVGSSGGFAIGQSAYKSVCSPGADVTAVWYRVSMLGIGDHAGLLSPYKSDGEFTDAVFRVAATFPMKRMECGVEYRGAPFNTEEFVREIERASEGSC